MQGVVKKDMDIAVKYQSRGGNTKAVAEVIANKLGVQATSIEIPLVKKVNILFLGGGAYMNDADKLLKAYIESIDPDLVGKIIVFSTSGRQDVANKKISQIAAAKGIAVSEHSLCLMMGLKGHAWLGLKGGKLNDKQINQINEFTTKVIEKP